MQIPSLLNRGRNGFNMTPMIDVVFLLIIFFLVASHLSDQDSQIDMELADARSAVGNEINPTGRLTINIPDDDRVLFEGEQITNEQLRNLIGQAIASGREDVEIRIRADRRVSYSTVSPVLNSCAESGIWNVTFAVYEKLESP